MKYIAYAIILLTIFSCEEKVDDLNNKNEETEAIDLDIKLLNESLIIPYDSVYIELSITSGELSGDLEMKFDGEDIDFIFENNILEFSVPNVTQGVKSVKIFDDGKVIKETEITVSAYEDIMIGGKVSVVTNLSEEVDIAISTTEDELGFITLDASSGLIESFLFESRNDQFKIGFTNGLPTEIITSEVYISLTDYTESTLLAVISDSLGNFNSATIEHSLEPIPKFPIEALNSRMSDSNDEMIKAIEGLMNVVSWVSCIGSLSSLPATIGASTVLVAINCSGPLLQLAGLFGNNGLEKIKKSNRAFGFGASIVECGANIKKGSLSCTNVIGELFSALFKKLDEKKEVLENGKVIKWREFKKTFPCENETAKYQLSAEYDEVESEVTLILEGGFANMDVCKNDSDCDQTPYPLILFDGKPQSGLKFKISRNTDLSIPHSIAITDYRSCTQQFDIILKIKEECVVPSMKYEERSYFEFGYDINCLENKNCECYSGCEDKCSFSSCEYRATINDITICNGIANMSVTYEVLCPVILGDCSDLTFEITDTFTMRKGIYVYSDDYWRIGFGIPSDRSHELSVAYSDFENLGVTTQTLFFYVDNMQEVLEHFIKY